MKRLQSADVNGHVGDVRDEERYTELLRRLAPFDHIVYSGVDTIIRGSIADADFDQAKHQFGVKFWGSAMTGKSEVLSRVTVCCAH